MIIKLARYQVRREAVAQAVELTRAFVDEVVRKEGGTAKYEAYQHKDEPTRFVHFMSFRTPSAEQYHQKTAWAKAFHEKLAPLSVAPPAVEEIAPLA
ncbi:MAG TPA: antibiotic biosynthesis monooxygenase [Candidatus Thermoplasmatota archaeon]|nr:antibiotic biosynthesis monooxygenase [Candidatus Thermoplasmatota archaeon]